MRRALLAIAFLLVGCGTTARLDNRLQHQVRLGTPRVQLLADYGEPAATRRTEDGLEILEFVHGTRSSSKTITRVVDGKPSSETITSTRPGKLRIIAYLREGKLVSYQLRPNR